MNIAETGIFTEHVLKVVIVQPKVAMYCIAVIDRSNETCIQKLFAAAGEASTAGLRRLLMMVFIGTVQSINELEEIVQ